MKNHYNRGQALLETAILVPFLLLLMIGVIDIGRYTYQAIEVGNSARAGAEYGSQNIGTALDYSGMQAAAVADAGNSKFVATAGCTTYSATCNVIASSMCVCASGATSVCLATDCPAPDHRLVYVSVESVDTFTSYFNYVGIPSSRKIDRTMTMQVSQ
jgi:Flp pilus assembly protein TadG